MITHLTSTEVAAVLAPSKRYEAEAYAEVFNSLSGEQGASLAHIETAFPGVKPAHVAFKLKELRGDNKAIVVDTHAEHGVCLIRVAGSKPKATAKKRTRKPAAAKKVTAAKK